MDLHHAVMDSFHQDSSPMNQGQGAAMISLRTPLIAATLALAGLGGHRAAPANRDLGGAGRRILVPVRRAASHALRGGSCTAPRLRLGPRLLAPAGPPPCLGGRPLGQGASRLCVPPARVVAARWPLGLRTRPLGP